MRTHNAHTSSEYKPQLVWLHVLQLKQLVPVQLSFLYWCVIDGGVWVCLGFVCGGVWVRGVNVFVEGDGVMIVGLFWRQEAVLILSIFVEGWGQRLK